MCNITHLDPNVFWLFMCMAMRISSSIRILLICVHSNTLNDYQFLCLLVFNKMCYHIKTWAQCSMMSLLLDLRIHDFLSQKYDRIQNMLQSPHI